MLYNEICNELEIICLRDFNSIQVVTQEYNHCKTCRDIIYCKTIFFSIIIPVEISCLIFLNPKLTKKITNSRIPLFIQVCNE